MTLTTDASIHAPDPGRKPIRFSDGARVLVTPLPVGLHLRWRTLEWLGVVVALFVQTGAISVLAFTGTDGTLTAEGVRLLQVMFLPVYGVTLILLARHYRQLVLAIRWNLPMAMLLAMPFLSALWSISGSTTLRRAIGLLLSVLLAYLIAIRFTPRQFLILIVTVLGSCMILSLAAAVATPGSATMPGSGDLRGVFNHKNVLGWNAAVAVAATAAVAFDRSFRLRRPGLLLLAASLGCLLMSRSTTALLSTVAAGFFATFFYVLMRVRGVARIALILVVLQIVGLTFMSLDMVLGAVLENTERDASLTGRVPLWAFVDEAIARRPILGYGYQAFWTEGNGAAWAIWDKVGWPAPHAHSAVRDSMLNLGLVGTALLLIMVVRALKYGALRQSRYPGEGWLWINVLVCMFLVMNLTESILMTQNSFLFIIFVAAVLMTSIRQMQP